jgi:hypothetical protein
MTEQIRHEDIALAYLAQFAGRTDAYSPWVPNDEGGQWIARREPLTPAVVIGAFRSKRPVGAYVAGVPDAEGHITSHLACLDVDIEPGGLLIADRIGRAMRKTGIPAYIETSRRGAHLWVLLDRPLPCPVIRRALRVLIEAAGVEPDPKIELRPGQDHLSGPEGLGNALRMPLMPHQTTGVAGELMEPGGRIVASRISEAVTNVEWASAAIVEEWAERWIDPAPPLPARDPSERPDKSIERFNDAVGVCEVLIQDWGAERAIPGRAIRCVAHDDHNPSLSIMRDDRRVFCHQPACLLNNDGRGRDAWDLAQLAPGRRRGAA